MKNNGNHSRNFNGQAQLSSSFPGRPLVTEFRKRWSENLFREAHFYALFQAITLTTPDSGLLLPSRKDANTASACEFYENFLDLYIIDEFKINNTNAHYPLVREHLRLCPRCRQTCYALKSILRDMQSEVKKSSSGQAIPPDVIIKRLSFLENNNIKRGDC